METITPCIQSVGSQVESQQAHRLVLSAAVNQYQLWRGQHAGQPVQTVTMTI